MAARFGYSRFLFLIRHHSGTCLRLPLQRTDIHDVAVAIVFSQKATVWLGFIVCSVVRYQYAKDLTQSNQKEKRQTITIEVNERLEIGTNDTRNVGYGI